MHLTFVKKILADGTLCAACTKVNTQLSIDGIFKFINHIAIADERDIDSEGMRLAIQYQALRAPFFLLKENNQTQVIDAYPKLKDVLQIRGLF